ncbi:MAG: GNAT family N-acetyltransferase [Gemmatimonadales bacterium]
MSATVRVETEASADDVAAVQAGLREFNVRVFGDPNEVPVTIFLRDDAGAVVGGLQGHIKWRWLYVSKLWIADSHRGKGHGFDLMNAAEDFGRSKNCIGSYLDTFEYQARPFYEKIGYEVFGTLDDYPPSYRQFFLSKRL